LLDRASVEVSGHLQGVSVVEMTVLVDLSGQISNLRDEVQRLLEAENSA
jgi:hypothetical protein